MRLELDPEEARELAAAVIERLIQDAGLSDKDRTALRKWRSDSLRPGAEQMRALTAKINEDIDRTLKDKQRSALVKSDWR
jgi:hypothetical protein